MRKPKPTPKNPLGLTKAELLQLYFQREARRRRKAEPQIRAAREAKAEDQHLRRLDREAGTAAALERRLKLLERYPSASAVRQLAEISRDRTAAEHCRVKASQLILRFADYGDDHSPGCPHLEDPGHGKRPLRL
jgi:hypothetical protein